MKSNNMKLSYQKHWHPTDGTVYNQRISMTEDEFHHLQGAFDAEIQRKLPRKKEYINTSGYEIYMRMIVRDNSNNCYMNNTQTKFSNLFLKLPLLDRNTYIHIK